MPASSNVERALLILEHLARHPGDHGVRSLAADLDLSPATAHRLLDTMTASGFVQRHEASSRYSIGLKSVQLGLSALGSLDLTAVAPACMRALVAETGESSFLAVLDEDEIVYLLKEEGSHSIRTTAKLGSRRPLHCTALGKVFLANMTPVEAETRVSKAGLPAFTSHTITNLPALWEELALTRARGFARDREEIEDGLMCLAAPVRDYRGSVVAAVSIAGPLSRFAPQEERFGRRITATALEISTALGYVPRSNPQASAKS